MQVDPIAARDARRRIVVIRAVIGRHPVGSVIRVIAEQSLRTQEARRGWYVAPREPGF
jgi:hypothetical protein